MSSFLEELNSSDDTQGSAPEPSGGESPFLIGLNASDAAPVSARKKHSGAIALAVAILAGAGGLYAMRTVGLSANVALAGAEIDYASKASPASVDHAALIGDLKRTGDIVQVPLVELPINPFAWNAVQEIEEPEPNPVVVEEVREDPTERARRERERLVRETYTMLTLNSVMGGRNPVVRISGEIYTLGDTVEGLFTIDRVEGRVVTLVADGEEYTLSIGE